MDDSYTLPLLVCHSQGGPYPDGPFMAGLELGAFRAALAVLAQSGAVSATWHVLTEHVPQVELLALDAGYPHMLTSRLVDPTMTAVTFHLTDQPITPRRTVAHDTGECPSCLAHSITTVTLDTGNGGEIVLSGCPRCRTGIYTAPPTGS